MKSGSRVVVCVVPRQMVHTASVLGHGGVPCRMPSSAGGGLVRSMCSCVAGGQLERNKSKEPRAKSRARQNATEVHLAECGFQFCSGLPAPNFCLRVFFFFFEALLAVEKPQ